ncbi:MAG: ATP-binding protein [Erysipelotrichaceae bacterium]|nr:ATP-binding protein [Erysipelotrichaceae bacterium]
MDNIFTVTFGQLPSSYINREHISENICRDFCLDFPLSHIYIISGVRGSGKTVLLTNVSKNIAEKKEWVVVDINPNREILEQIASGIYENTHVKHLFLSKSFSFSFHGFGFSIEGDTPVSNVKTILEKMLNVLKKHNKKLLITIDEASNNIHMRSFAHDFQSLLRSDYPVFTLMTGLYENVNSLQNNKNLTFLYRAPKIELHPLNKESIIKEYSSIFSNEKHETIETLAELTKGYAFAYQVVGYLFSKYNKIEKIYDELDQYLSIYVYDKIWSALPKNEKELLRCFEKDEMSTEELIKKVPFDIKSFSVYRDRLIKRGLIIGNEYGKASLSLPRFNVFVSNQPNI